MENMVKYGPKYMEGYIWDERGKTNILQILISHEKATINSIQFIYVVDKKVVPSKVHGEPNGLKLDIVTFEQPGEYLVSVNGLFCSLDDKMVSISFGTNYQKYGPFGKAGECSVKNRYDKFDYKFRAKSSFGGFYGSVYDSCVSAIGVYINPTGSLGETETDFVSVKSEDELNTCSKISERKVVKKRVRGF